MTVNQGVELGFEQRSVWTVKTAGLTPPFMIFCARHPIHGNNCQRRTDTDIQEVREQLKLGKHCLWPKINNCLKAHSSFIG